MAKKGELTEKQKLFAEEYLKDLNAARAYKEIYKVKKDETAKVNGCRLLTNANVKKYIDEQLEKIHTEKTADAAEVMEYLTSVMRGESSSEVVVVEGIGEGCSRAKTMDKAPDERERLKAAELIGKRYRLFTGRIEAEMDTDMELNVHINYGNDSSGNNS